MSYHVADIQSVITFQFQIMSVHAFPHVTIVVDYVYSLLLFNFTTGFITLIYFYDKSLPKNPVFTFPRSPSFKTTVTALVTSAALKKESNCPFLYYKRLLHAVLLTQYSYTYMHESDP